MHELSLCGSIAEIVRRRADGRRVETIHLRIGELRQVVPDTLTYCWMVVTDETPLAGSELDVERVAGRVRCEACADERNLGGELDFACSSCGQPAMTVVAGEEFLVTSIDVAAREVTT